jgi:hypothetical protein
MGSRATRIAETVTLSVEAWEHVKDYAAAWSIAGFESRTVSMDALRALDERMGWQTGFDAERKLRASRPDCEMCAELGRLLGQ